MNIKTPSFRIVGGKSRLRNWLIQRFPQSGNTYLEPFAGMGNVFYEARQRLSFQKWLLNDRPEQILFFQALMQADLNKLPETGEITKANFKEWHERAKYGDHIAILVEPRITFGGKGYQAGFSGSSGTHVGYKKSLYMKNCLLARELIDGKYGYFSDHPKAVLSGMSWDKIRYSKLGPDDFVYFDPPYFGTSNPYPSIDHEKIVEVLNKAKFKWALSGYPNHVYDKLHFKSQTSVVRNSEIKSSNKGSRTPVAEHLWANYEFPENIIDTQG